MALTGGSDKHFYAIDFSFLLLGGDPAKIAAFLDMAIDSGDPASPLIQIVVWESPFDLSWVSARGRLAARGLSTPSPLAGAGAPPPLRPCTTPWPRVARQRHHRHRGRPPTRPRRHRAAQDLHRLIKRRSMTGAAALAASRDHDTLPQHPP